MKKSIITVLFLIAASCFSQNKEVLFSIDKTPVLVEEFKKMYEKNIDLIQDKESKDIDSYLDLYINFKLKIKEALDLKLDQSPAFKREFATYKKQLANPYLQDSLSLNNLVKEAYFRTKNEINASHILVRFPKRIAPKDTLQYYNKILGYYHRIKGGEPFDKLAFEVSEDPSAKKNKGDLGYFSAFKMVYPFEDMAYKTKLNDVSKPFKTRFGYHLVKVNALRSSKGEFEVAHILINDKSIVGKSKIDTVYAKLIKGEKFSSLAKTFSTDGGTAKKGGRLPRFGTGKMVEEFESEVFLLEKEGDYSKPFKTKYGWHIVKLLKKYPILSFEKMKKRLTKKVKSNGRAMASHKQLVKKLKKEYKIEVDNKALALFENEKNSLLSKENLQKTLVTINNKNLMQEAFYNFKKRFKQQSTQEILNQFIDKEIITYFKENLIHTEPDYKSALQEYKEGLLLFDLMQQKVWNKASKDTLGLQKFFNNSKEFKNKKLEDVKGKAIGAYQDYLDKNWIASLRKKATIKINKKALRKFKEEYK